MDIAALVFFLGSLGHVAQMPATAATHGRVLDASGQAIAGATVTLQERDSARTRVVVTDAAGRFTISELLPGVFGIRVDHPAHRTAHVRPTALPEASELALTMTPR